jgi:hypothetical protein
MRKGFEEVHRCQYGGAERKVELHDDASKRVMRHYAVVDKIEAIEGFYAKLCYGEQTQ